jgi:hypothetical protein
MGTKTSLYISEELDKILPRYIDCYGSLSGAINGALLSLDAMYRIERRHLKNLFTEGEIKLMLNDALNTAYVPQFIQGAVLADTEDEIDATFENYGVNRTVILDKLRGLTLSQQYALVDWLMELRGKEPPAPEK